MAEPFVLLEVGVGLPEVLYGPEDLEGCRWEWRLITSPKQLNSLTARRAVWLSNGSDEYRLAVQACLTTVGSLWGVNLVITDVDPLCGMK